MAEGFILNRAVAVQIAAGVAPFADGLLNYQLQSFLYHHAVPVVEMGGVAVGANQPAKLFRGDVFRQPSAKEQCFQFVGRHGVGYVQAQPLRQREPVQRFAADDVAPVAAVIVFVGTVPGADGIEQGDVPGLGMAGGGAQATDDVVRGRRRGGLPVRFRDDGGGIGRS